MQTSIPNHTFLSPKNKEGRGVGIFDTGKEIRNMTDIKMIKRCGTSF